MVLWCDVAAGGAHVDARLVHATVAELHLVRLGTSSKAQYLVAQADPKNWRPGSLLHQSANVTDESHALLRVAWPVTQKEAVELFLSEIVVPWDHREFHAAHVHQVSDDVV